MEHFQTGRGVPVLIPEECSPALTFLTNPVVREKSGIRSTNTYIFANGGTAHAGVV